WGRSPLTAEANRGGPREQAWALGAFSAAHQRQVGAVGRAAGQPYVCPLLRQPDRVAAFRALGIQHSRGLLLWPVVGRRMIGLSPRAAELTKLYRLKPDPMLK